MYNSTIFDIEEDNNTGDVVNYILFPLPCFKSRPHEILSSTFRISFQKEWIDDVGDLLILEKFPNAITCQNYHFIRRGHAYFSDLRNGIDAHTARNLVTK